MPSATPTATPAGWADPDAAWLPAGWNHAVECDEETSRCELHLYDEAGNEQPGWPVPIDEDCYPDVAVGPGGVVYFACSAGRRVVVEAITMAGTPLDGWPVRIRGTGADGTWNDFGWGGGSGIDVAPDGTVYVGIRSGDWPAGAYAIHALGPDGRARQGWPRQLAGGAQGFSLAPDGVVVAWWYEGVEEGMGIGARRTRFTMLGPDGRTLPGWPIGSRGAASGPVTWRDGSIYYTSESGRVWAHDRSGAVIDGWPYQLSRPVAPAFRPDGRLMFLVDLDDAGEVVVLTRRGRMAPGWPYRTPGTLSAVSCDTGTFGYIPQVLAPDGTLYLAPRTGRRTEVIALDPDGRVVDGWPYRLSRGWHVSWMRLDPDRTLRVSLESEGCGEYGSGGEISLAPDGSLVGPAEPAAPTPLDEVYSALRPRGLRSTGGTTTIRQGEEITFAYDLVNRSTTRVILPHVMLDDGDERRYAAGAHQAWLERLGPETETDCMPWAGRKGSWYAAGGHAIISDEPVVLKPGEGLLGMGGIDGGLSSCLPAGEYRYHVEYWPIDGYMDDEDPIASRSIEFTLTPAAGGTASPSPTPAP